MNADAHHTRAHAQWSASATSRNCVCPGAIAMSSMCEDVEREVAAWGTCAHQIAEGLLRHEDWNITADLTIGTTQKSGKFEFVVDAEMANTAQTYVDYCRGRLDEYYYSNEREAAEFWIEKPLSLDALDPPLQAGGTGDFVIWFPKWKLLEVVDLKGGRGVTVDVVGNPQGRSYAIGAILSLPGIQPERVRVTIVQPRVGDGLPKSDEFHVADLMDWTHDLLGHMRRSADALEEFGAIETNSVKFDEWAEKWLTPGQCTFCTAKPICPALRKKALAAMPELARKWHEDTTLETPPALGNLAKLGSIEELEHDLDGIDALKEWIGARAAYAKLLAEQGTKFTNWYLADSVGHRKYVEKDTKKLAATLIEKFNLTDDQVYEEREVKSPAQLEKVLKGAAKKEFIAADKTLWVKPVTGKNLVRRDRTERPEAKGLAERHHEQVEN